MCSTSMHLGELLDARAPGGVLLQQRAHGVGDLAAPAVADGDVDEHPVDVTGVVLGRLEPGRGVGRAAGRAPRPGGCASGASRRASSTAFSMMPSSGSQLLLRAVEVVGRQQPQGDDLDPDLVAPRQEVRDLVGTRLVTLARPGAAGLGPAAVAVEHDADVARDGRGVELPGEATGVGGIEDVAQPHVRRVLPPAPEPHRAVADGAPHATPVTHASLSRHRKPTVA